MSVLLPADISTEALLNYLPRSRRRPELAGPHKRNAYADLASVATEEGADGITTVAVARAGMYDILPECLFHPVDRYENLPANNYEERFAEEYEQQIAEEADARRFFAPFDSFVLELGCAVARIKDSYADNGAIAGILADSLPEQMRANRFVARALQFLPVCSRMRGDKALIALMLRKVLSDEGLRIEARNVHCLHCDELPRYGCHLDDEGDTYLGNEYEQAATVYSIPYWSEDECGDGFLTFVSEMAVLERFVSDFFTGVEEQVRFVVATDAPPAVLADDARNYLDYNTNL